MAQHNGGMTGLGADSGLSAYRRRQQIAVARAKDAATLPDWSEDLSEN